MRTRMWLTAVLALSICGCADKHFVANPAELSVNHPAEIGLGRVSHVVVCWMKEPKNADAYQKLVMASEQFRTMPGVDQLIIGRSIPSTRPVVDSSYDLSIVFVFKDVASLRAYETSAQHQQTVRDVLKPLVARYVVYDAQERSSKSDPDKKE